MASSEASGISVEGEWTQELMALRGWLAEDHLDPTRPDMDPDARSSHEASATEENTVAEQEGDSMNLMQRGRRPWWHRQRSRSRSPRRRTRRERNERMREVERTNEHRPWRTEGADQEGQRTSSFMSARPFCSGPVPASVPREGRTRHPARISTPQEERNMGIHVWHILADMASAHDDPPENLSYGLRPTQRLNVEATLDRMTDGERVHMLISFVRMVALLLNDVAAIAEQVVGANDIEGTEGAGDEEEEGDEAGLMEKFLVKPSTKAAEPKEDTKGPRQLDEIFASQFELQLRTLISALELGSGTTMTQRAKALLERLKLRYGHGGSEAVQYNVALMTPSCRRMRKSRNTGTHSKNSACKIEILSSTGGIYLIHILEATKALERRVLAQRLRTTSRCPSLLLPSSQKKNSTSFDNTKKKIGWRGRDWTGKSLKTGTRRMPAGDRQSGGRFPKDGRRFDAEPRSISLQGLGAVGVPGSAWIQSNPAWSSPTARTRTSERWTSADNDVDVDAW